MPNEGGVGKRCGQYNESDIRCKKEMKSGGEDGGGRQMKRIRKERGGGAIQEEGVINMRTEGSDVARYDGSKKSFHVKSKTQNK